MTEPRAEHAGTRPKDLGGLGQQGVQGQARARKVRKVGKGRLVSQQMGVNVDINQDSPPPHRSLCMNHASHVVAVDK